MDFDGRRKKAFDDPKAQTGSSLEERWRDRSWNKGGVSILAYEEKTIRGEEEKEMDRERKDSKGSRVSRCKCVRAMHLSPLGVRVYTYTRSFARSTRVSEYVTRLASVSVRHAHACRRNDERVRARNRAE